jgi:NADPH2:quinone reductase
MHETFRAVTAGRFGPPDFYQLKARRIEAPGTGTVRVRVSAAALSYADMLAARGGHQAKAALPFTPGSEFAGIVDAIGENVSGVAVGDPVTGVCGSGALAEMVTIHAPGLRPLPAGLQLVEAAGLRVNTATALHALADRGTLAPGETLLVLGAAGGVGSAAVQIGKAIGARVIAVASSAEKRDFALANGADEAIDYAAVVGRETLRAMTGGQGADLVFDPVGGVSFDAAFRSLAWRGRYLAVGFASGTIPSLPINLALVKGTALIGVDIGRFTILEPMQARANEARIEQWYADRILSPAIARVFSLEAYADAMVAAFDGTGCGRVVVRMA